jgi:hypothetical protein
VTRTGPASGTAARGADQTTERTNAAAATIVTPFDFELTLTHPSREASGVERYASRIREVFTVRSESAETLGFLAQ